MKKMLLLFLAFAVCVSADTSGTNYALRSRLKKELNITGSNPMQGDLNMGTNDIVDVGNIVADSLTVDSVDANSVTVSGLTETRVVFAGAGGILIDDADLAFILDTLYPTNITASGTGTFGTITDGFATLTQGSWTDVNSITYTLDHVPGSEPEGLVWWNPTDHGLNSSSGLGPVAQIPFESWIVVRNETGDTIDDGLIVYINGSSNGRPTVTLAKADIPNTADRTIGFATMDIPTGTEGIVTIFGAVRGIDTSGCAAGDQLYLSATTKGHFTPTQPSYPNFIIKVGSCTISDADDGEIGVNVVGRIEDIIENAWNGVTIQSFDARTNSDGATVTMSLEKSGGGDIFLNFSDGLTVLDCDPTPCTIELTTGTDTVPQVNYIYIPQSTKVLTKSTSSFPFGTEHIKIGFFFVSSATKVAADGGALINQNWNDHIAGSDGQGHTTHLGEQNRYNKGYFSGIAANGTDQAAATSYFHFVGASEAYFKSTSGVMYQLHRHSIPAIDTQSGGDDIHVANWSGDNYHEIADLADIVADSTGASLGNSYFNVFFFSVGNKTGEYSPLMAMVPNGSYSTEGSAINDVDRFNNTTMPREFGLDSSVGVPVCLMTMRWTGGLTTLSHISTEDLRQGGGTGGSGAAGTTDFADNQFTVFDADDVTRIIDFDAGSITTGNTRTITMADADVDLADIATNTTAIGLNTTHRSSDGSDHSFIDQSVISGSTPTFTGTNFTGIDADDVNITDVGVIITATEVEGALQENRTAIDLNTAKDTNVTTNLSLGAVDATTMIVASSDGTDATLIEANTNDAGLLGAVKWDEIVANSLHSADNTQAHTDYLINNGNDSTSGDLTANSFIGPLTGNADTVTTNANLTGIVTSVGNATAIANKAIAIAKLADGTDGELITWDAAGVIDTVAVGTATHVLTSNGVGAAPTFQAAAGGSPEGTAVLSTGEVGGTKFLREDGDGTCSWQASAGGGDVTKVGTPVDNEIGVWTGDGTIEGDSNFTWDGSLFNIASGTADIGGVTGSVTAALRVKSNSGHRAINIVENSGNESWSIGVNVDGDLEFFNSAGATSLFTLLDDGSFEFAGSGGIEINSNIFRALSGSYIFQPPGDSNGILRIARGVTSSASRGSGFYLTNNEADPFDSSLSAFGMLARSDLTQLMQFVGDTCGNQIIFSNLDNRGANHDHATQTNPTVYVHSDTSPDTNNTQWLSFTHDQTNAVFGLGSGAYTFPDGDAEFDVDTLVVDATGHTVNINSSTAVDAILDEDAMGSDSATALATQQSIKAYVDSHGFVDRGDPAAGDYILTDLTTGDSNWHDLDLGTDVGVPAGAKAVSLAILLEDNVANTRLRFRKNGNTNVFNTSVVRVQAANIVMNMDVTVPLDASAIIEYETGSATFTDLRITVKGWFY
ncbi:hypothetical protein KAR91_57400 [Candidatus Pacearchaeota archaeon]|nr:hypothetical protein [Candidatus Pacearchaeota archaeon]